MKIRCAGAAGRGPAHQWHCRDSRRQRIAGEQGSHHRLTDPQIAGDGGKCAYRNDLGGDVHERGSRQHRERDRDPRRPRADARRIRGVGVVQERTSLAIAADASASLVSASAPLRQPPGSRSGSDAPRAIRERPTATRC